MKTPTRMIVLAYTKFGESSVVLHTLSAEYGRRSFLVKTGKRTPMSLFLPLNILEGTVVENPKSTLWKAYGFSSQDSLIGIRNDLRKNTITMFMSEVLYRTVKDGENEEGFFDWCISQIMLLNALEGNYSNFHINFLLELSAALGFSPTVEDIAPFAREHFTQIRDFLRSDFPSAMLIPLSGEERNSICEEILSYLEYHTESRINVRSLGVLKELYR
ncbi:MAG: DNA repair protein RecO C-terminal domain-containing protein [Bacteroidales bacterium]|nr:DNA repair protein RecO C-terminal domain-containing protein [Bacteroidales bacterium]MBQ9712205.1 DNA repair protein RecO C-terminal domain-containing protein [Bacteroidales bacterium]MBR1436608.1 DNA repair protein RecO C-terminal domain-containing protein [Bacteroidales bacterium]MBR6414727.1 DNA repair protein RecO C-terminal domain-containing protein [Bacteroidales bacterium]